MVIIKDKIFIFIIIVFFLLLSDCNKNSDKNNSIINNQILQEDTKQISDYGVANVDRLRLRLKSDLQSKTIRYLDKGEIVKIIGKNNKREKIDEIEDFWILIEFNGIQGWVFGYYLDIYTNYDDAESGSRKYLSLIPNKNNEIIFYSEENVNNNLFYLSEGKICMITDMNTGEVNILKTGKNITVLNYYFTKNPEIIFYIGKQQNIKKSKNILYKYNMDTGENLVVLKSVYSIFLDKDSNQAIIIVLEKKISHEEWVLSIFDMTKLQVVKKILKITKGKEEEIKKEDYFSVSLNIEFGNLIYLDWNKKSNIVYFKPPEENQTYLVSVNDGNYIKTDMEKSNVFNIDSARYISVSSSQDDSAKTFYSLVLKDKITGFEKEITRSQLYPINFSVSPRQNYIAISMISMNNIKGNYYPSSIYVLSLSNFSIYPVTKNKNAYQPKWIISHQGTNL